VYLETFKEKLSCSQVQNVCYFMTYYVLLRLNSISSVRSVYTLLQSSMTEACLDSRDKLSRAWNKQNKSTNKNHSTESRVHCASLSVHVLNTSELSFLFSLGLVSGS